MGSLRCTAVAPCRLSADLGILGLTAAAAAGPFSLFTAAVAGTVAFQLFLVFSPQFTLGLALLMLPLCACTGRP